ncbi:hypothetical protein [Citrobacter portucalensis]|uniref:hypothetical protein n=1 Tax=Citrobacter portucalensis TaxID=1639133 RepID=UPI001950F517|nr:hypothetical protein [Citrobacter portucalensis]MBM6612503.1 hypothetical protein [Citrobacter portucalensis]
MSKTIKNITKGNNHHDWLTVNEAIGAFKNLNKNITKSDIYRYALAGKITLSIYFQSPVMLKEIKVTNQKIKLKIIKKPSRNNINSLEINNEKLIVSTEENYISLIKQIVDTSLAGYEYVLVQRLLAQSLGIPNPVTGAVNANYGISVIIEKKLFQVFMLQSHQTEILAKNIKSVQDDVYQDNSNTNHNRIYHPLFDLPQDSCFVIKQSEIERMMITTIPEEKTSCTETRISSPLSKLFWLACKNNDSISPLIGHPYKLVNIFEQWASAEGITDRFSGDTLKTALERGSPK